MTIQRPEYENAPWREPYGYAATREGLRKVDPDDGWRNYKRSTVYVDNNALLEPVETTYHVETVRTTIWGEPKEDGTPTRTGAWSFFLEWIDPLGEPHREILPWAVIERMIRQRDTLNTENASRSAKEAAQYRRQQATAGDELDPDDDPDQIAGAGE